jgi:Protein of unknown function (DUF2846)
MMKTKMMGLALACAAATASPAATPAKTSVAIGAPMAGKGQIVFFRPSAMGMAIRCTVRENGAMVGRVGNGKYFVMAVAPGKHTYTAATEAKDTLNMEVESGETYYVKCKIGAGIMGGRPNLSPSDKAAFDAKSAKLKLKSAEDIAEEAAEDAKAK